MSPWCYWWTCLLLIPSIQPLSNKSVVGVKTKAMVEPNLNESPDISCSLCSCLGYCYSKHLTWSFFPEIDHSLVGDHFYCNDFILLFRKSGYRCLLASEVVQLLCIVPVFFDFLGKDPGKEYWTNFWSLQWTCVWYNQQSYLISIAQE